VYIPFVHRNNSNVHNKGDNNYNNSSSLLSQQASGACDTSQLPPDRLVQSITGVAAQLVTVRQNNIVPNSPRFTTTILAYYKKTQVCNRWPLAGPTQHRKWKAPERLMSVQRCRLGYKSW